MARRPSSNRSSELDTLAAGWLRAQRSVNTQAAYGSDLAHFREWCAGNHRQPLAFSATDLAHYRAACEEAGSSAASVARRLSAVASFLRYATDHGVEGDADVFDRVDRPSAPEHSPTAELSDLDAAALLDAADEVGAKAAFMVRLLMLDGLKVGEAVAANASDVAGRPPRMSLRLPRRDGIHLALHRDTAKAAWRYLSNRRVGPLLTRHTTGDDHRRLTRFGVDYILKRVAETAGLDIAVSGNTLRRRFVTAAHANGDDLDEIRKSAGHLDPRTTRRLLGPD
jgi:integrase/recombinase XerD